MKYVSTRGAAPPVGFADVLLEGLAPDGGLYLPESWPQLSSPPPIGERARDYATTAIDVMSPFVDDIDPAVFATIVREAYATFDHPDVTPLIELDNDLWLLELFHGPTLAFKDIALQLVGRLMDHVLAQRGERSTIVCATSGDTGSAAIQACRDRDALDIFVLQPNGRASEIQRRQMTTVDAPNVHNLAIDGTFDDCQDLVKALFSDETLRNRLHLGAMNSINWARVMAQTVYFVVAAERLTARRSPVSFAVPTGNFGNVYAGWAARSMGLPVQQLVVAANRNDILSRFLATGELRVEAVTPTLSPSMDIQISSNLERLLFELLGRDGHAVTELQERFRGEGVVAIGEDHHLALGEVWRGMRIDDDGPGGTKAIIAETFERTGILVDPHTAVGLGAARAHLEPGIPMVALATADPAKFPDAVEAAIGSRPPMSETLAALFDRDEQFTVLPNDLAAVRRHIEDRALILR